MTGRDSRIDQIQSAIKALGRSSPAGTHWHEFYEFLRTRSKPGKKQPPVPLILVFQAEDGIRDYKVTGVQTCALPIPNIPIAQLTLAQHGVEEQEITQG